MALPGNYLHFDNSRRVNLTRRANRASAATVVLALCACSTIRSEKVEPTNASPSVGMVYYLPIRTLAVESKFIILDCGRKGDTAELLYDVKPTVTAAVTADRSRVFTIADGLDGKFMKAMNFEITQYENGTLKGVNVIADDRTAETATNILSGALKFGLALTGSSLFSGGREQDATIWLRELDEANAPGEVARVREVCGAQTTDALLKVHKLTRSLSGAREASEAKAKLAAAVTEAEKAVIEARATLKAANEAGGDEDKTMARTTLKAAVEKLAAARAAAQNPADAAGSTAINQDITATVQRHLTYSASKMFVPLEGERPFGRTLVYSIEDLQAAGIRKPAVALEAHLVLEPVAASGTSVETPQSVRQDPSAGLSDGIWFRSPSSAHMRICVKTCGDSGTTDRFSQVVTVPQWGQLTRLPLRNKMFAKNTTKLSFAPDGTLTSLGSDSTAAAERASGAFLQSGEMVLDYAAKRRTLLGEFAAAKSTAEKAEIQQQLDILALNQQLSAAQSTLGPERDAQLATWTFQIQQLEKEIQLLELQKKKQLLEAAPE